MIVGMSVAVVFNGTSVTVGVSVGGVPEEGNSCGAFWVNWALTVCATLVLMMSVSENGLAGSEQAKLAANNRANDK